MPSKDIESLSGSTWSSRSRNSSGPETIQSSSSSIYSDITDEDGPTMGPSPTRHISRLTRHLSLSESPLSRARSLRFGGHRASTEPTDQGRLAELRSEISINSSASQIRSTIRGFAKRLDRRATDLYSSVGSFIEHLSPTYQEVKDSPVDGLDLRGRELEVVLEGALGISEHLQVKFFDKYKDIIKEDMQARNLEAQNAKIRNLDHQMFTTIAFYGDNGTGKSSLINALLDGECITPTSNDASCTATPIEFRTRDRGQHMNKKYTVIADILTDEEWRPFAKRLLDNLHENPSDNSAKNILQTLFSLPEDGASITLTMIEKLPFHHPESSTFKRRFATQELSELQEHVENLNKLYWVALKKITIYMDSPVLNTGVILVDLPGLKDIDPMKMEMAARYISTCETIFIVSNISRAVNNVNNLLSDLVVGSIARQAQLDNPSKISLILTQTDNITKTGNNPNWNKKEAIRERIEKTRQQFQESSDPRIRRADLFCVSSLEYQWHHGRLVDPNVIPCLGSDDSEIPHLREFIQKKGLRQRESVIRTLVEGNMKTFMTSIQSWCDKGYSASTGINLFGGLRESVDEALATHGWGVLDSIVKEFKAEISAGEAIKNSVVQAAKLPDEWIKSHHTTFEAACRARGEMPTGNNEKSLHLNKDLAAPLILNVTGPWEASFHTDLDSEAKPDPEAPRVPGSLKNFSQSLTEAVHGKIRDSLKQVNPDIELRSIYLLIFHIVCTQEDKWRKSLNNINRIFTDKNEWMIKHRMEHIYGKCLAITDRGAKAGRMNLMKSALPAIMLDHYTEICNDVFEDLDKLVVCTKKALTTELQPVLDTIESSYFFAPGANTVDLSAIKTELLTLSKFMEELEGRAKQLRAPRPAPQHGWTM